MIAGLRGLWVDTREKVVRDIYTDPYLRLILLLSLLLNIFWIWVRIPNFITPDEYGRILRPIKAGGNFAVDPGISSFARGATDGLAQGATFYLYGLTLIPTAVYIIFTGKMGVFSGFSSIDSRWVLWHSVPEWFWNSSILSARFMNVIIGVTAVYVMYCIGKEIKDESLGRFSSLILTISLGFVSTVHEANEDTAMLLLLLLTLYTVIRYVKTGRHTMFYVGSVVGGLTIAFKLTGGVTVLLIGFGYLLRATRDDETVFRPKLLTKGALLGLVTIYISMPNVLFMGPGSLYNNVVIQLSGKSQPLYVGTPPKYLFLRSYLNGLGLPLFLASVVSIPFGLKKVWVGEEGREFILLVFAGLTSYILVFLMWTNIRTHHLLPTYPFLAVLVSLSLREIWGGSGDLGGISGILDASQFGTEHILRVMVVFLIVSTAGYCVAGDLLYMSEPRDEATSWISNNVGQNETMVVYEDSVADLGLVHGEPVEHYDFPQEQIDEGSVRNESRYTEWMLSTPDLGFDYIQVTSHEMDYVDPLSSESVRYPRRSGFISRLVEGGYGYKVVAEFGDEPDFPSYGLRLLRSGVVPDIEKRMDYVVILEECSNCTVTG